MNQKAFAVTAVIVLVIVIASVMGYLVFAQKSYMNVPISSPASMSQPENNVVSVSLGQQFVLKQGQVARVVGTDLEIEITKFYNSPCPPGMQCIWSGVGIEFEYRFNGEVKKGRNIAPSQLVQVFGYKITIVGTDHETYANLVIEKTEQSSL